MSNSTRNRRSEAPPGSSDKLILGCLLAFGALLLLGLSLSQTTLFGASCEPVYEEYEAIFAEARSLNEERTSKAVWNGFAEEAENRIEPLVDQLLEECEDHPSSTGRGAIVSYVGFQSEGEKTQMVRRPLIQFGYRLLSEIKNASKSGKLDGSAVVEQLKVLRAGMDGVSRADQISLSAREGLDESPKFDWMLWGIVLVDGILVVAMVGPSVRRWYES